MFRRLVKALRPFGGQPLPDGTKLQPLSCDTELSSFLFYILTIAFSMVTFGISLGLVLAGNLLYRPSAQFLIGWTSLWLALAVVFIIIRITKVPISVEHADGYGYDLPWYAMLVWAIFTVVVLGAVSNIIILHKEGIGEQTQAYLECRNATLQNDPTADKKDYWNRCNPYGNFEDQSYGMIAVYAVPTLIFDVLMVWRMSVRPHRLYKRSIRPRLTQKNDLEKGDNCAVQ